MVEAPAFLVYDCRAENVGTLIIDLEYFTIRKEEDSMETKYYVVDRIDGDYAWLKRTDDDAEPILVARALLPGEINEGTRLKQEFLQYEII